MSPKQTFKKSTKLTSKTFLCLSLLSSWTVLYSLPLEAIPKLPTSDSAYEIPSEDQSYKYYLGVSEGTDTVKDGMTEAFDQAAQEAIRENYGVLTQIDTDSYATDKDSQILRRFKQQSGEIALKGFEKIDSKIIKNSTTNKYQVQALYRYNKIAIQQELVRLNARGPASVEADLVHSSVGSLDNEELGGLRVSTKPSGANIYLNDDPYLRSPIDIVNQIPPGKYTLKIDHPYFETISEEILIRANETTKIAKVLKPAHGQINLISTPTGAAVKINGKVVGLTPLVRHKVLAGVPVRIDVSHKDAYAMSLHAYSVEKDQLRAESFEMKLKPGNLVLSTNAPGAVIQIDGVPQSLRQRNFQLPAGSHKFEVVAPGYEPLVNVFEIRSNRTSTERMELQKESPRSLASVETTPVTSVPSEPPSTPTPATHSFFSKFYLGMGVAAEVLSNPVVGKVDPNTGIPSTNSETKNNSNGTSVSPLLNVEFGLKNGIGLFYSAGFIRKTTGADPVDANGPLITEANRKKFGVTLNFESENGNLFQIGGESEIMDAEVVTSLAVGSGSSRSIIKTSTLAKLTGRGLYFGWVGRSDTTLTSLKLGIMDYTFDHKSFKGTQSIFLSLGVSFDLWRGWSR